MNIFFKFVIKSEILSGVIINHIYSIIVIKTFYQFQTKIGVIAWLIFQTIVLNR